jgi:hypothetical protein|tara:strand:- start:295 stop:585 length:291 start_codon:yes stop_codon:yes gene_type:complete
MKLAKDFVTIDELVVNSPPHYKQGDVECIEAIKSATGAEYQGYLQGNIMKYIWRYRAKGQRLNDLKKAQWYLKELIVDEQKRLAEKDNEASNHRGC